MERVKIGIHFLFGSKEPVTDFREVIDRFASLGFNCVELPPDPFLSQEGDSAAASSGCIRLKDLVNYAAEKGVEIIFSCGFPEWCDMASDRLSVRRQGRERLSQILELMECTHIGLLGGTFYTKWPSYRTEKLLMSEKQKVVERTAACLRETMKAFKGSPIELAVEPLNRFEGFLINTAKEGVSFCQMVDSPQVGLMLDGFHMSMEEDSVLEAVRTAGSYLKHLHLAENNRKLPGQGCFCWDEYFGALKTVGYAGRFDIESFMTSEGSVAASVALWRDLEEGADRKREDEMLKEAIGFIEQRCRTSGF